MTIQNTSAGFGRLSALERIGNVVFVNLGKKNLAVANAPANFPFLWMHLGSIGSNTTVPSTSPWPATSVRPWAFILRSI